MTIAVITDLSNCYLELTLVTFYKHVQCSKTVERPEVDVRFYNIQQYLMAFCAQKFPKIVLEEFFGTQHIILIAYKHSMDRGEGTFPFDYCNDGGMKL